MCGWLDRWMINLKNVILVFTRACCGRVFSGGLNWRRSSLSLLNEPTPLWSLHTACLQLLLYLSHTYNTHVHTQTHTYTQTVTLVIKIQTESIEDKVRNASGTDVGQTKQEHDTKNRKLILTINWKKEAENGSCFELYQINDKQTKRQQKTAPVSCRWIVWQVIVSSLQPSVCYMSHWAFSAYMWMRRRKAEKNMRM